MDLHVLEEKTPLSETLLWEIQKVGYEIRGPSAWAGTNNPLFAESYAWMIYSFLLDWLEARQDTPLQLDKPLYIMDIGCGAPHFGVMLIRKLLELFEHTKGLKGLKPCLVLIDNIDKYANYWLQHPRLKPLFERDMVDYAVIDTRFQEEIHLHRAGIPLNKESLVNPLINTLNYFLDQIPMELYRIGDGVLERGLVSVLSPTQADLKSLAGKQDLLQKLECKFDFEPMEAIGAQCDGDSFAEQVLQEYLESLPKGTRFMFGASGMRLIRYFTELGAPGVLTLTGDKGELTVQNILQHQFKRPIWHGEVFSFDPNLHAVRRYLHLLGGFSLAPMDPAHRFFVLANVTGMDEPAARHLQTAVNICQMGKRMVGYATLAHAVVNPELEQSLSVFLEMAELSEFDPYLIHGLTKKVWQELAKADDKIKERMLQTLKRTWENFFWVGEKDSFKVLRLVHGFCLLNESKVAMECLDELSELGVETAHMHFYYAVSNQQQQHLGKAKKHLQKTLEIDPNYAEAKVLLQRLFG